MRILINSMPGVGAMYPMVPTAWALAGAGHDVLVAACGDAVVVHTAGLDVVDLSPGDDIYALFSKVAAAHPALLPELFATRSHDLREEAIAFAHLAEHLVDRALEVATAWRPDLIVYLHVDGAALVVADKLGIPAVAHGFGFGRNAGIRKILQENMTGVLDRLGVAELPEPAAFLDVAPPSMVAETEGWSLRYVPYNGSRVLPDWLLAAPGRPRIAVTRGTRVPGIFGLAAIKPLIAAAADTDAEFVLAVGDVDLGELGELPPNVRPVGYVPLGALLRTCAGLVHHGGASSTFTALSAGVPQLVLPEGGGDAYINADSVSARGAGLAGEVDQVDAALLTTLVRDEKLRAAATGVRDEMATMPVAADLVPRLTGLAG